MTKENDPKTAPVKHKDYPVDKLAELTRAIAESRAVIYLGAGASASAGLPSHPRRRLAVSGSRAATPGSLGLCCHRVGMLAPATNPL